MSDYSAVADFSQEQAGYKQTLTRRHVQMIAIGGAIGSGLFLGSARLLHITGPALIVTYAIAGFLALCILLALGELVLHRPSSSAFVSYTREFFGERAAFFVGWLYWLQWTITGVADLSAVGSYLSPAFEHRTWPGAIIGFFIVIALNMFSARAFAEFEFWASLLKVVAIVIFLIAAVVLVVFGLKVGDTHAGLHNLYSGDGFWPVGSGHNWFFPILVLNSVIFAYVAVELVAVAAGEMEDPEREVQRAIKSVLGRIGLFYIGTIFLLVCLLPTANYIPEVSPFVTVANGINNTVLHVWAPRIITVVLIVAALSSLNSGMYASGRILRGLAMRNQAPQFVSKLNSRGVPLAAISLTAAFLVGGIVLNYMLPVDKESGNMVFDVAVEVGALAIIGVWAAILLCHLKFRRMVNAGELKPSSFRVPFFPFFNIAGLIILFFTVIFCWWGGSPTPVTLGTGHHFSTSQLAMLLFPVAIIIMVLGWFRVRATVSELAENPAAHSKRPRV